MHKPEELRPGLTAEFQRAVTAEDVIAFARNSGDMNPLHVDEQYAAGTNFGRCVVHGAYQVGLASAMIGMYLPGRDVLLVSVRAHFGKPLYYPSTVRVTGELVSWNPDQVRGSVRVTLSADGAVVSEIHMGFTFHDRRERAGETPLASTVHASVTDTAKTVVVTGASGGVGSAIVENLASDHRVVAVFNSGLLPPNVMEHPNVSRAQLDFSVPGWEQRLRDALSASGLYAIVHAAWPGMPHGGLLKVHPDTLSQQVTFGTVHTVQLAKILADHVSPAGGRFIALSSIVGTHKPLLNAAAYSLGKAALENTIRLLAPELALKKITANAICPSFIAAGMNQQANARQQLAEKALIPIGRLCTTDDVVGAVRFLLSSAGEFLSGESLALAGGQLL